MEFQDLLASISADTYERLVQAVETGRWPDGVALTEAQKENTVQLVMAYQATYCPSAEPFRIGADGLLVTRSKREMRDNLKQDTQQTIATFPLSAEES
ncbi:YeaC family protein [Pseudidiomarina sp. E22-M8]|uniref:YeaC family protein n=1 Tax=Pseudidiomarina sp. E22-M8 TaxID=3424768 RepID=UPI00403C6E4D